MGQRKRRQPKGRCKYLICVYAEEKKEEEPNRGGGGGEQGTEFVYLKSSGTSGLNGITW